MSEHPLPPGLVQGRPLSIKIIGIGNAGITMLDCMAQTDLAALPACAVHANARALETSACRERVLLGAKRLRGIGTGGDPDMGRVVAEEEAARLKDVCAQADLVLLVAGLGGGTGTGVAPIVARIARESGALVLALVTLPFEFEGARRARQAAVGVQALKASADAVICLPNEKIRQLIDEHQSILKGFELTRGMLIETARGIWHMLTRPALIHTDFSYLYSVLRGRQAESCVSVVQGMGENRAQSVIDQLASSVWLDQGRALKEADGVLVSLVGGAEMTLAEVNTIMEWLNRTVQKPQLIMGAAIDAEYAGRIRAIVVASRHTQLDEAGDGDQPGATDRAQSELGGADTTFFNSPEAPRATSRFVAPAPELPQEKAQELLAKQRGRAGKRTPRFRQEQLPLEIISKGRFEKSHPTIHHGEDLDVPTYIRRGIPLN